MNEKSHLDTVYFFTVIFPELTDQRVSHLMQDERPSEEDFVFTEAEKDQLKRKRSASTPATQRLSEGSPSGQYAASEEEEDQGRSPDLSLSMRKNHPVSLKGPAYREVDEEEDEGEGEEGEADEPEPETDGPDLHQYFGLYDIDDAKVISMCRAYASYLVSLKPKTPPKPLGSRRAKAPPSQKPHWMQAKKRRK